MPNQRVNLEVGVAADTRRYEAGMRRVERATRGTNAQLDRTQRRMRDVATQSRRTETAFNRLAVRLAGLVIGFAAVERAARGFVNTLNEIQQLENRLRLVTESSEQLNNVWDTLIDISRQARAPLQAVAQEYTRMAISIDEAVISSEDLLRITRILALNEAATGITGPSVRAARIQLIQGLAADELRGQELRSVREQDPATALLLARGLGIDVGDLRSFAEEQDGISGTQIRDALLSQEQEVLDRFRQISVTIQMAFNDIQTASFEMVNRFDELTGIGDDLANVLVDFANIIRGINLSFPARLYQAAGEGFQYLDRAREFLGLGGQAAVGAGIAGVSVTGDLALLRQEENLRQQLRFRRERGISAERASRIQLRLDNLRGTDQFRRATRLRDSLSRARAFATRTGVAGAAAGGLLELASFIDRQGFGQFRQGRDVSGLSDDELGDLIQTLRLDRETFRDLISAAEAERGAGERVQLPDIAGGGTLDISAFDQDTLDDLQAVFRRIENDLLTALADQFRRADEAAGRITRGEQEAADTGSLVDEAERIRLNRQLFEVLDTIAEQQASVSSPQINRAVGILANRALAEDRRLAGQAGLSDAFARLAIFSPPVNEPLIQSIDELAARLEELGGTFRRVTPEMRQHTMEVERLGQSIAETLVEGIRRGASAAQIFGDIATQILDRIIQQAITNPVGDAIGDFLLSAAFNSVIGLGPSPTPAGGGFSNPVSGYSIGPGATAATVASTRGLSINVNGVQDPTIVRNEIERMYPTIAQVATGATVRASRRPGPVRRFVG